MFLCSGKESWGTLPMVLCAATFRFSHGVPLYTNVFQLVAPGRRPPTVRVRARGLQVWPYIGRMDSAVTLGQRGQIRVRLQSVDPTSL
jgi:hypothetical protein